MKACDPPFKKRPKSFIKKYISVLKNFFKQDCFKTTFENENLSYLFALLSEKLFCLIFKIKYSYFIDEYLFNSSQSFYNSRKSLLLMKN